MAGPSLSAEHLRREIEAAFADAKYPGDDRLVYDTSGYHLECNDIAAEFRCKHWKEIPLGILRRRHAALSFFTPEAYRYYLPAYLLATLCHYDEADIIPDVVLNSLMATSDARGLDDYRRKIEGFSPKQRKAIRSFLEFLKTHYAEHDPLGDVDKSLASLQAIGD